MSNALSRFHGWQVVWVGAAVLIVGSYGQRLPLTFRSALLDAPADFHDAWFFALVSVVMVGLLPSLAMPCAGWAIDRWGARPLILLGLAAVGIGGILALANQVWGIWYLSNVVVAVGGSAGVPLPGIAAVKQLVPEAPRPSHGCPDAAVQCVVCRDPAALVGVGVLEGSVLLAGIAGRGSHGFDTGLATLPIDEESSRGSWPAS